MTNMRTMPPNTPPKIIPVVIVNDESTGSLSSTNSNLDELKDPHFPQNASKDCWDGESLLQNGRRASTATETTEVSIGKDDKLQPAQKESSTDEEPEQRKIATRTRRTRAQSFSAVSPHTRSPYNPYSQHSYAPRECPGRISTINIWMEPKHHDEPTVQFRNLKRHENDSSSQSSVDSMNSDEELEQMGNKIRSEIRQMELHELALEAEKAAEAGEEMFVGRASTFGDDSDVDLSNVLLKPPRLKMRRNRTEGSLRPSLMTRTRSLRAVSKLKVLALRDVNEVIPRLGDLHTHLRSHLANHGVDQRIIQPGSPASNESDTPSVSSSMGKSMTFLKNLKLWGSHISPPHLDSPRRSRFARRMSVNMWKSSAPASPGNNSLTKKPFLTPRRPIHIEDSEFSPNSLIDSGENDIHERSEDELSLQSLTELQVRKNITCFNDSGEVGRVLAQHIAATPPPTRGPLRVPSGLVMPDISVVLEKEELNADMTTNSDEALPGADTGTISTAFSTSSSFDAGTDTNRTPPISLFDVTKEQVDTIPAKSLTAQENTRKKTPRIIGDQNGTFATPMGLRDIRGRHRRCCSDGELSIVSLGQFEVNTIGCETRNTPFAPLLVEEFAKDTVPLQAAKFRSGEFSLEMRPSNNGLAEISDAQMFFDMDNSALQFSDVSEIAEHLSAASVDSSTGGVVTSGVHGKDSPASDLIETSQSPHHSVGQTRELGANPELARGKTGLDCKSTTDVASDIFQDENMDMHQPHGTGKGIASALSKTTLAVSTKDATGNRVVETDDSDLNGGFLGFTSNLAMAIKDTANQTGTDCMSSDERTKDRIDLSQREETCLRPTQITTEQKAAEKSTARASAEIVLAETGGVLHAALDEPHNLRRDVSMPTRAKESHHGCKVESADESSLKYGRKGCDTDRSTDGGIPHEFKTEFSAATQPEIYRDVVNEDKRPNQSSDIPPSELMYPGVQHGETNAANHHAEKGKPGSEANHCQLTPTYQSCEWIISPLSTTESASSNPIIESDEMMATMARRESNGSLRRVMSLPSLTDALNPDGELAPSNRVHSEKKIATGKSEPGAPTFGSGFDVTVLKQRFASGQSEPGRSSLATRFDLAAKKMLERLSSHPERGNRPRGLFVPVKDNDAFLNNYLYCTKPTETKSEPSKPAAAALCETSSVPCTDIVGCGGFIGAVDAAMEILPSRTSEKEIFSLNNGSTHSVDDVDRWFDAAVERFDGAFERLVGSSHEHDSRWKLNDFHAPSLMVKKTTEASKSNVSPKDGRSLTDQQFQLLYGMSRDHFRSLPRSERVKVKEKRSRFISSGSHPPVKMIIDRADSQLTAQLQNKATG